MSRFILLGTVLYCSLICPVTCSAQSALLKRIKAVQNVPIWQRVRRSNTELRRLLKQLHSSDKGEMQDAIEQIALTRPIPTATDLVTEQADAVAKKTKDKFALSMAFEIKGDWREAKKAAETLQVAQRNGGLRYLEQAIVRGNASQASGPLIAAAYSGNKQAERLVAAYWSKSRIPGKRAILIIGPAVAPELAAQLRTADRSGQMELAGLLGKVGTEKELPTLEALASKADPNLRRRIDEAIQEIKAREAEESSK